LPNFYGLSKSAYGRWVSETKWFARASWFAERLAMLDQRVCVRLGQLSSRLGDADWLDNVFGAGDLMMVTVLRRLNGSGLLEKFSKPRRVCGPRRSAARLPACVR
jgi:hypothetical protein